MLPSLAEPLDRRRTRVALIAITAVAVIWRLVRIDAESLWYDEVISHDLASRSPSEIVADRAEDGHPPTYFLLLHLWTAVFGSSPFSIRALSLVPGALSIPLLYAVAARWRGAWAGLFAAALAAFSPFLVRYSTEAREYAFLFLFATASFLALDRAREKPTVGRVALWSVSLAVTLWSGVFGMAVFAAQALWLGGAGVAALVRRAPARPPVGAGLPWAVGLLAALAAFAPWLVVIAGRSGSKAAEAWVPLPSVAAIPDAFRAIAGTRRSLALLAPVLLLGVWREVLARGADRRRGAFLLTWLCGPVVVPVVVSWLVIPVYLERGAIAAVAPFLVLAASGLDALRGRRWWFAAAAACAVVAVGVGLARQVSRESREDWRGTAATLSKKTVPEDLVLVKDDVERTALSLYGFGAGREVREHREALEGRVPWRDRRSLWFVVSPQAGRAAAMADALVAAGFRRTVSDTVGGVLVERWER